MVVASFHQDICAVLEYNAAAFVGKDTKRFIQQCWFCRSSIGLCCFILFRYIRCSNTDNRVFVKFD